jgi:hypothetical protein
MFTINDQQAEKLKTIKNQLKNDSRKLVDIKLALAPSDIRYLKITNKDNQTRNPINPKFLRHLKNPWISKAQ